MTFNLLNELLQLHERRNHLGEFEYTSYSSWRAACKKADAEVWFDGTSDICNAFVGHKPYKRGSTRAIGEWDGSVGVLFKADKAKEEPPKDDKED